MPSWLEDYMPLIIQYGLRVVGVIALLLGAWIVARWARRAVERGLDKASVDPTLGKFFSNMARWGVIIIALIAALGMFGVQTTSFAALIGAAGLAIGLAFQGALGNLASGTMLLLFRPFKVGDVVEVAGEIGKVNEIDLFFTTMDTPDNKRIIIPNGQVFGAVIENITYHDKRRVDVSVGTDYGEDLQKVREVLLTAIEDIENKLEDEEHQVYLDSLGGSSIDWKVRVWAKTADYWGVKETLTKAVYDRLNEADIGIPYPQMDVHLDNISPLEMAPPPGQKAA